MKNFVLNLRRIIGEETDTGFETVVVSNNETLNVPNFTYKDQEDVYPKTVISAFIDYLPISKGDSETDENTKFTTHKGKVQIDVLTKDDVECIDITETINQRFKDFFQCEIVDYIDPYEWESLDVTDIGVRINPNYNTERQIVKVANYIKVLTIEELRATENTWMLDDTGLYVNGDFLHATITEVINGLTFPEGDTVLERGFVGLNPNNTMKEMPSEEYTTTRFTLEYEIFYNVYRTVKTMDGIDVIGVER